MSEDYYQQKLLAVWSPARGVWEKPGTVSLLCEHSELYSETWRSSGMMRDGKVFALPKREHHTKDSASSYLRTPAASEAERGHQPEDKARARGGQVTLSGQFMNLPTPMVSDTFTDKMKSAQRKEGSMHSVTLSQAVHMTFGRFEPVVTRWEKITGIPAPAPTKPDGKDGVHRLSSEFTEWMMGLSPGWITGVGLSRKEELRACGNGVVPQQAELALRRLIGEIDG